MKKAVVSKRAIESQSFCINSPAMISVTFLLIDVWKDQHSVVFCKLYLIIGQNKLLNSGLQQTQVWRDLHAHLSRCPGA